MGIAAFLVLVATVFAEPYSNEEGSEAARSGEVTYRTYCLGCHGVEGHGDGPEADSLKRKPADLTLLAERAGGEFPERRVLQVVLGEPDDLDAEMMIWCDLLRLASGSPDASRERAGDLVAYVESLQRPPVPEP